MTAGFTAGSASGYEYESNGTSAKANPLTAGVAITGQLASSTDVDYYKISTTQAGVLSIAFDAPGNSSLNYFNLALYDVNGVLLGQYTTGSDKTYTFGAAAAGTYYVAASAATYYDSNQYSLTAGFTAGSASGYEYESNGTSAKANPLTAGVAITGQLASSTDVDYYKISTTQAGVLSIAFDAPGNSSLNYFNLALYDVNGVLLGQYTTGSDKTYTFGAAAAGTYYVAASAAALAAT